MISNKKSKSIYLLKGRNILRFILSNAFSKATEFKKCFRKLLDIALSSLITQYIRYFILLKA